MTQPREAPPDARTEGGRVPASKRRGERLVGLLVAGTLIFNFPLLAIFHEATLIAGIPVLYLYLFSVWASLVGATALVLRGGAPKPPPGGRPEA